MARPAHQAVTDRVQCKEGYGLEEPPPPPDRRRVQVPICQGVWTDPGDFSFWRFAPKIWAFFGKVLPKMALLTDSGGGAIFWGVTQTALQYMRGECVLQPDVPPPHLPNPDHHSPFPQSPGCAARGALSWSLHCKIPAARSTCGALVRAKGVVRPFCVTSVSRLVSFHPCRLCCEHIVSGVPCGVCGHA